MTKILLEKIAGAGLIIYIISIPFLGLPIAACLIPIILLDLVSVNSFSWKIHSWTWSERIGDVLSIVSVSVLGYVRASIDFDYTCDWPVWLQYGLGIIIVDTFGYWLHYLAHRCTLLWKLHRVHHSRSCPNILNASYEHFLDAIFRLIAPGMILILFHFDPEVITSISGLTAMVGAVSHLNLRVTIPQPFIWIVVNPVTHRLHHHKDEVAVNNGNLSHAWDHLMCTYALYEMEPDDYGLIPQEHISDNPIHVFFTSLK